MVAKEREDPGLRSESWAVPLISRALLAPSSHNTQPWTFRISESAVELLVDRRRALPINDPDDRELAISCGTALMNLRLAAASRGWGTQVELLPEAQEPDLMARVTVDRAGSASNTEADLAASIERRRTCRKPFAERELPGEILKQVEAAATAEGAWLRALVEPGMRARAADLVSEGDAAQWRDPRWRQELASWMRPRGRGDGLTVPGALGPGIRFAVRRFDMGARVGAADRALAMKAPLLVVLGTTGDGVNDRLVAGQALQRVLLVACRAGLQAGYLNQPLQVAALRPRLAEQTGGGHPQILMRLGFPARPLPEAPRRSVEEVLVEPGRGSHGT